MISESLPGTLEVLRKFQIRESFGPVQRNAMPTAPARAPAMISKVGHSRGLRPLPPTPKKKTLTPLLSTSQDSPGTLSDQFRHLFFTLGVNFRAPRHPLGSIFRAPRDAGTAPGSDSGRCGDRKSLPGRGKRLRPSGVQWIEHPPGDPG